MNKLLTVLLLTFVCSLFLLVPSTEAKTVSTHHSKKHHKQHHVAVRHHHKAHRVHTA